MNWLRLGLAGTLAITMWAGMTKDAVAKGRVSVRGYTRRDGTRVRSYTRRAPGSGGTYGGSYPGGFNASTRPGGRPQLQMVDAPLPPLYIWPEDIWRTAASRARPEVVTSPSQPAPSAQAARPIVQTIDARKWRDFSNEFVSTTAQGRAMLQALEEGASPEEMCQRFFPTHPLDSTYSRYFCTRVEALLQ